MAGNGKRKIMKKIFKSADKWLKKIPFLRNLLVYLYHFLRRVVVGTKRKLSGYETGILTKGKLITPYGKNCYFGYYDKSAFSSDGKHYIYLMINGKKKPKVGEKAKVCYASSETDYKILGETLAWNSQQGAMLRFVSDEVIAWNDYDESSDQYITIFFDVKTGEKRKLMSPLYDLSDDGKKGLSLEFERLNVDAEGYGYIQQQKKSFSKDSYIDLVDVITGKKKTIITIDSITKMFPIPEAATFSYFNHLEFNPSGNRFIFIFRYLLDGKRISRLFSSDIEGKEIHLLADEEMVSHCTWKDDEHITLWCRINRQDNYYTITDKEIPEMVILGENTPNEDGHRTYNTDRTKIITDTYPDKAEYRHLIVYDCVEDSMRDIARFYAPVLLHGPLRCDFHPRWNPNMKQVVIDSVHEGFRGMYLIDIE